MSAPYLVLPRLLPVDAVPVGSLVCSLLDPHIDVLKPPVEIEDGESLLSTATSLSGFIQESRSRRFSAALTQLLNVHTQPGSGGGTYLSSSAVKRYELSSQRKRFAELCANEEAREWLEEGVKAGEKSYLVVGVMTVLDANVVQTHTKRAGTGFDVTAPVSTALTGGIPLPGILDPGVGAEWSKEKDEGVSFTAPGEMIWGLAYRRIKFRSFKRKTADTAFLDQTIHWKPLVGQRAKDAADEEELEVELEDIGLGEEQELEEFAQDDENESFIIPKSAQSVVLL
ncbi:hypothetical protein B0J12DRAFT_384129 [Macrophomina phaseolina]|uniref:Uncharacterized protein n=1 Tax=Macrophomina phaseolina TaxID=35725 RepID=A0ABQ8FU51_9PEZI|nr:hypothetical protein B0J12DRAFT_384129 [Macrophomina phaseolina]